MGKEIQSSSSVLVVVVVVVVACCAVSDALALPETKTECSAHRFWNKVYYENLATHATSWNKPEGCDATPADECSSKDNILEHSSHSLVHVGANLDLSMEGSIKFFEGIHRAWEPLPPDSITLTIQAGFSRIQSGALNRIASQWNGPVSCAVLSTSHSDLLYYLAHNANSAVKTWVDLHLALTSNQWKHYPINKMRNYALKGARTKYVFVVDIDEDIPFPMSKYLDLLSKTRPEAFGGKTVFVMPSFQWAIENPPKDTPADIPKLTKMFEKGHATVKHPDYPPAYEVPEISFWKWRVLSQPKLIQYQDSFEPYFIARRGSIPMFDERFEGFGGNKAIHSLRLAMEGYRFVAVPGMFTWSRDTPSQAGQFRAPPKPQLLIDAWWELGHTHGCDRCCVGCCVVNCPELFNHYSTAASIDTTSVQNVPDALQEAVNAPPATQPQLEQETQQTQQQQQQQQQQQTQQQQQQQGIPSGVNTLSTSSVPTTASSSLGIEQQQQQQQQQQQEDERPKQGNAMPQVKPNIRMLLVANAHH